MERTNETADREIRMSRVLNAPIELVWEVWTNPDHIQQWWGPDGFKNTIHKMEFRENGAWDLIMHGPDGTDYKNKSIYKEIVKHKRIVYEHVSGPKFLATIEFEAQGKKTRIEWQMLFESRELLIETVKTFGAEEGLTQTIGRLAAYVEKWVDTD